MVPPALFILLHLLPPPPPHAEPRNLSRSNAELWNPRQCGEPRTANVKVKNPSQTYLTMTELPIVHNGR